MVQISCLLQPLSGSSLSVPLKATLAQLKCIFPVQDSVQLFLWKHQTHENQRSQVSSQAREVYSTVTDRAPGWCTEDAVSPGQATWTAISPCFQAHWELFNLDGGGQPG